MTKELIEIIKEDKTYYFGNKLKHIVRFITHNPVYMIGKYIIVSRKAGYYRLNHKSIFSKILLLFYLRKKNKLGEKLNIELGPNEFGRRIKIYHRNIVVNAGAIIGDDCELYGNNCIGNKGANSAPLDAPIIGNRVSVGVGTKIIGKVNVCDDVKISSMSLVNKNIDIKNSLFGGVPVKFIRNIKNNED